MDIIKESLFVYLDKGITSGTPARTQMPGLDN